MGIYAYGAPHANNFSYFPYNVKKLLVTLKVPNVANINGNRNSTDG